MRRSLFDHPEARRMRPPLGWRAFFYADQTALKRRCFAILDGLPEPDAEHHKDELDRRLAEVHELVREAAFTRGASAEGLIGLLRTQLEVGNLAIVPRLFAWAIPDWRLQPWTIPVVSAAVGAGVVLSLITAPNVLPILMLLALTALVVVWAVGSGAMSRATHVVEVMRLERQLETLLETGPADAAAAKYEELRTALRARVNESIVRTVTIRAARHVAESPMFKKDKDVLRKVVDDAVTVVRAPRASMVQLHVATEALRAAGPALVPIDRDAAYAVAGILDDLAARPGFHGWGCRRAANEIRRDLGEPWVV